MASRSSVLGLVAFTTIGLACQAAHADRIAAPPAKRPMEIAPRPNASPYSVDIIGEDGGVMTAHRHRGRFYVAGQARRRYTIRVKNPTAKRVEAVVSVDGLDVIDGKRAEVRGKRGYVVPAYGELRVDGFRVSSSQVAAFRFSSVSQSYAGRKGKARNVGVIGVAIFEERGAPQIIVEQSRPRPHRYRRYRQEHHLDSDASRDDAPARPAAQPPATRAPAADSGGAAAPAKSTAKRSSMRRRGCCGGLAEPKRPGLGTRFGERRHSNVSFTRFVRANPRVPTAIAELRYNDRAGLSALGIHLTPSPSTHELRLRESANPFPTTGYASPPAGWQ